MRLSSDSSSPDHHPAAHYIQDVTVDGAAIKQCISFDTVAGEALVASQPVRGDEDGNVVTHIVRGKIGIVWRNNAVKSDNGILNSDKMFQYTKKDWEDRENFRIEKEKAMAMGFASGTPVGKPMGVDEHGNALPISVSQAFDVPGYENVVLHQGNVEKPYPEHILYSDADEHIPDVICDSNGQVCLALCKVCGRGECELEEPCTPRQPSTEFP